MSKSNVLELAKKLVAAIEEEDRKNKVMLKDIPVGGKFDTGIGRFIVLEQKEDSTVVITEGLYREDVKFDDDCTDYKKSSLRELCEGEILNEFSDEFGEENICTATESGSWNTPSDRGKTLIGFIKNWRLFSALMGIFITGSIWKTLDQSKTSDI